LAWLSVPTSNSSIASSSIPFNCEQKMGHACWHLNLNRAAISCIATTTACTSTGQNLAKAYKD
jgi:hypothetical protein